MFDLNNQMFGNSNYPPGFNNWSGGNPMLQNQRQQAFGMLQPQFGAFRQPAGMGGPYTMQSQLFGAMGGLGPMGQVFAPYVSQFLGSQVFGTDLSNLPPFGTTYDPGTFIMRGQTNRSAGFRPNIPTHSFNVKDPVAANIAIERQRQNDSFFRNVEAVTAGWAKASGGGVDDQILAAQTAGDAVNWMRSNPNDPIAQMMRGGLEMLGVENDQILTSSVSNVANNYMGMARYGYAREAGESRGKGFGPSLAEGLAERVADPTSALSDLGYRRTGEVLEQLGSRNLLDIGGANLNGVLDKNQLNELKDRAIKQVEDIASIFEAGKEIGLSVDETLTAFQAFTGGDLSRRMKRAEDYAVRTRQGGSAQDAISEARRATAEQTSDAFREAQIQAELAGTDLPTLMALSTMGAAQLEGMGAPGGGAQTAILGEMLSLSSAAQGTGVSNSEISTMATRRVGVFMRSRTGRAAAVLKNAVSTGQIEKTPEIQKLLDQFEATGELNASEVQKAFSAQGVGRDEQISMFSDAGIKTAWANTEVAADVVDIMSTSEKHNVTGQMRKFIRKQLGTERFQGLLKSTGLSSGQLEIAILRGMQGLGKGSVQAELDALGVGGAAGDLLSTFGATIEGHGRLIEVNDEGVSNIQATMRSENPELRKAARQAAKGERAMRDYITDMVQTKSTREALKAEGYTDTDIDDMLADDEKFTAALDKRETDALGLDKEAEEARAKGDVKKADALAQQASDLRTGSDKIREARSKTPPGLKQMGDLLGAFFTSIGKGETLDSTKIATLQESLQEALGLDREGVIAAVTGTLGVRGSDGILTGLSEEGKKWAAENDLSEERALDMIQKMDIEMRKNVQKDPDADSGDVGKDGGDKDAPEAKEGQDGKDAANVAISELGAFIKDELPDKVALAIVDGLIKSSDSVNVFVSNADDIKTVVIPTEEDHNS